MAYVVRGRETTSAAATSLAILMPAHQSGDLLVIGANQDGNATWTAPSGWTVQEDIQQSTQAHGALYTKVAASSSEAATISSTASEEWCAYCWVVRGFDATTPIHASNSNSASAEPSTVTGVTTTNNDCLILHYLGVDLASRPAINPGFRLHGYNQSGTGCSYHAVSHIQETAGATGGPTVNHAEQANRHHVGLTIAINDAATSEMPGYCTGGIGTISHFNNNSQTGNWGATPLNADTIGGLAVSTSAFTPGSGSGDGVNKLQYYVTQRIDTSTSPINIYGRGHSFSTVSFASANRRLLGAHWRNTGDLIESLGNRGVVFALNSASTAADWRAFLVSGSDAQDFAPSAWYVSIIDPGATDTDLETSGSYDETDVTNFSLLGSTTAGNAVLALQKIFYIDPFVVKGGSTLQPARFLDVAHYAEGAVTLTNARQGNRQYLVRCAIDVEANVFNATAFAMEFARKTNEVLGRAGFHVRDGLIGIKFNPASGQTHAISSCVIDLADHAYFETASGAAGAMAADGAAILNAYRTDLYVGTFTSCTFDGGAIIDPHSATLTNCTISNKTDAGLLFNSTATISGCAFNDNNIGVRISTAGTYTFDALTFSGNTNDVENDSGGSVTINITNGGDTPTVLNTGVGSSTTVQNTVVLSFSGIVSGSRLYIEAAAGGPAVAGTEIYNQTVSADPLNINYDFTSNQPIIYRVRKSSASPYYRALAGSGTITSSGFSVVISQELDE